MAIDRREGTYHMAHMNAGDWEYTVEAGGGIRMRSSRSMVLQPRRVGYMSGELGEEGLASGHCHDREAA